MRLIGSGSTALVSAFALAWIVQPASAQQQVTITPADRAAYQEFLRVCAQPLAAMKRFVATQGETVTDAQVREMFIAIPPLMRDTAKEEKITLVAALRESRAQMKKEADDPNSKDPSNKVLAPTMLCWLDLLIANETGGTKAAPGASPSAPAPPSPTPSSPSPSSAGADPVIMSAGGITIRQSEFEQAITTLPASYQPYARGAGKRQFAEDYMRMRLLADAGTKAGLASDADVITQLELMRQNLIANAHLKAIEKEIDATLRQKYAGAGDGRLYSRHILIGFQGSGVSQPGKPDLTAAEAKAKADALHAQILAGASFEELARKESYDSSASEGGDLGVFIQGQNIEEFEKAVLATPPGQLAPVTRSQFGYHVIRPERRGAGGAPLGDVAMKAERKTLLDAALARLVASASPFYSDAYFGVKKD